MKTIFQRVIAIVLVVASVGWIGGIDFAKAATGFLYDTSVTLSDPVADTGTGTQTFTLKTDTPGATTAVKKIQLAYRISPAGSGPTTNVFGGTPTWDSVSGSMGLLDDWTASFGENTLTLTHDTTLVAAAGSTLGFVLGGVVNPAVGAAECPAYASDASSTAGTCYIYIKTMSEADATIDETTVPFTVTTPVQVSARVESQLNFWVAGTATTDAVPGLTATNFTANSAYNSIDYGSVIASSSVVEGNAANKSEYQGHKLYVKTNASNGYDVKVSLLNAAENGAFLDGTYGGNTIPGSGHAWGAPAAWAMPGTAGGTGGIHGFIAAHTNDSDVTGFGAAAKVWGDMTTTGVLVSTSTDPDDGTTARTVSYGMIVDIQQPADQYTGTLVYNCVGKY